MIFPIRLAICLIFAGSLSTLLSGQQSNPKERDFKVLQEQAVLRYEGTPVAGAHKRMRRAEHFLKSHLNADGQVFNYVMANLEALEQLYIDTFPATIDGDWQHIGPLNSQGTGFMEEGLGRVNQIHFASSTTWYAGTAGGGLWRTDIAGIWPGGGPYPWSPLTDSLPSIAISGIETDPSDVDDVFILTGDGDGSNTFAGRGTQPGIGVLHSTDGGMTWSPTALQYPDTNLQAGYKLIRYPGSIDTMFAACTDSLFLTTDGWNSYTTPVGLRCYDVEFKPNDPQTIYAACQGSLQRSTTGITGFTDITANLVQTNITPNSLMGRMAIAVTPDDPNALYVIISETRANGSGLLSFQVSFDSGSTFLETNDGTLNILAADDPLTNGTGQGNYDLAIWADPGNANTVIVGGVNLWKSTSAGVLWEQLVHWTNSPPEYTHADVHAIESLNGDIIVGTDGGLYLSENGGFDWHNRGRGLGITQYYHMNVYAGFLGLPLLMGGAQDNGTSTGFGFNDNVFEMAGGGDGFRCFQGVYDGHNVRYRSSQNGRLYSQVEFGGIWLEDEITPETELDGQGQGMGAWDTPYQPSPGSIVDLIAGYDDLYFSTDAGDDWAMLSVNPPSGTYDGSELITQLAWAPSNTNVVYFYISDGSARHLWRCNQIYVGVITSSLANADCSVIDLDTIPNMATNNPSHIGLNPYNEDEIWLSFDGYNDSLKVFYNPDVSSDTPWINISYNLPNVPVHCVERDVDGVLAGTDIGVFFLPHGTDEWIYYSQGLPTVAVTEIQIRNTILGKKIFASTWGRGMWYASPPVPPRQTRWYVDSSATGLNNGANWANAFPDLQTALDTILPGDSIWVANGTYYPDTNVGFHLFYDNVYIWGGFAGTEDSISQRNYETNATILSGDLGVAGDSLDNAHHVFMFGGHNGNVLLDGFHITEGFAHGTQEHTKGGGIYYATGAQNGKPVIRNCRIYRNSAKGGPGAGGGVYGYGGGMFIGDSDEGDPAMFLTNCVFEDNYAQYRGGALYIDCERQFVFQLQSADTGTATVYLNSCTFENNGANTQGGAVYVEAVKTGRVKLTIDSSTFQNNRLDWFSGDGAGMYFDVNIGQPGELDLTVTNTSFLDHNANSNSDGGAVYIDGPSADVCASWINCTFDNNDANTGGAIMVYTTGALGQTIMTFDDCTFTNSDAQRGGAIQFSTSADGHTDVEFTNCVFDSNSALLRAGVIYFNADINGNFDVTLDSCNFSNNTANENGAIRAYIRRSVPTQPSGTGDFTITNSTFENNQGTGATAGGAVGFWADGGTVTSNISATDFISNTCGSVGGGVAYVHFHTDSSSITADLADCNFVQNTAPTGNGNYGGGALYLDKTNATVTGCTFSNNEGKFGGAVYNIAQSSNNTFSQSFNSCIFEGNHGSDRGGGVYVGHNSPSTMTLDFVQCTFDSNYTTEVFNSRGGAIYQFGTGRCTETILNTDFTDNYAVIDGGALYISGFSAPADTLFLIVDSCTFTNNDGGATGKSVELYAHNLRIVSNWSDTHFYNDELNTIFQNRADGTGFAEATFHNCTLNLITPPQPSMAPATAEQNNPP